MSSWHKGQHLESNINIPAALRQGQSWEYNQIIRADREPIWLQHLQKRSTYSRAAQEHPPLMKGVSFVLVKVKPPSREGALHQTKTQQGVTELTAVKSSKAKTTLPKQGWEGEQLPGQQHRATGRQEDTSACWRGHWEYSHTPAVVTHFNTYYGSPAKASTWFTGRSFPGVSTTHVSGCQGILTHTHRLSTSQRLVLSADSLNCEVKLLLSQQPEGSESVATEAVVLQEQVILQETLEVLSPRAALTTTAKSLPHQSPNQLKPQTLQRCHPAVKPSLLLPLRLLYPAKDVVKQNL